MVVPYSTCESAGSSVVQVMVAPVPVTLVAWTAPIAGGAVSAGAVVAKTTSTQ